MKVLLLNPPAKRKVVRDYYCSKTSKSSYLFAPIDLLLQSGVLAKDNELLVIDAVAQEMGVKKCLGELKKYHPRIILGLIGAVDLREDLDFYRQLKLSIPSAKIFLTGEPVLEDSEEWLKVNPFIDGILLRFISQGLAQYLAGKAEPEGIVFRDDGEIKFFAPKADKEYSVGRARQELFQFRRYFFSFAKKRRFATILTDFGCPYKCGFCVMSSLGYQRRRLEEVEEELEYLNWLGIKELFVQDQSFGSGGEHSKKVMGLFKKYGFSYTAFVRPDHQEERFWRELKDSGCHTVIVGVESGDDEILRIYNKGYTSAEAYEGIWRAKSAGLRVVATVIIGLPEDSLESIGRTMGFIKRVKPDFVSYNLAVARGLTKLRDKAREEGLISRLEMDQGGSFAGMRTRSLNEKELIELKKKAVRDFYFRMGYIWDRLKGIRSLYDFYALFREGMAVWFKNI